MVEIEIISEGYDRDVLSHEVYEKGEGGTVITSFHNINIGRHAHFLVIINQINFH